MRDNNCRAEKGSERLSRTPFAKKKQASPLLSSLDCCSCSWYFSAVQLWKDDEPKTAYPLKWTRKRNRPMEEKESGKKRNDRRGMPKRAVVSSKLLHQSKHNADLQRKRPLIKTTAIASSHQQRSTSSPTNGISHQSAAGFNKSSECHNPKERKRVREEGRERGNLALAGRRK